MSRVDRDNLIFKALADKKRRRILDLLRDQPRTTGEICGRFKRLDRCTVMQHLDVLEKAELILVQRKGRFRWNYVNAVPFKEIYERWISKYASHAVDFLARLKRDVEE